MMYVVTYCSAFKVDLIIIEPRCAQIKYICVQMLLSMMYF